MFVLDGRENFHPQSQQKFTLFEFLDASVCTIEVFLGYYFQEEYEDNSSVSGVTHMIDLES